MHPLLARFSRFAAYLLAWVPLTAMLVYLVAVPGGFGPRTTALVIAPSALVYAFVCLSTWFSCKLLPLDKSSTVRVFAIHAAGACVAGFIWAAATLAYSRVVFEWLRAGAGESRRFAQQAGPILVGAGVLLYLLSVAFHYVLASAAARKQAELREREARVLASEAELRALKAQVNPHFLFNSLNSISALTSVDPAGAREMCVLLGDFLRHTLGLGERAVIPLRDELAMVRNFLAIERVRFGGRLRVEEEVENAAEACLVPPLVLQPLVENAVKHGIANLAEGGFVRLEARRENGGLMVAVENAFDPEYIAPRKSGLGLVNVRRRLETRYGERAALRIFTNGDRYRVRLSLPLEEK
ncbi:MAG TPA: histidine kinase [Bryobacteraceae bacterium]|nr:histidine kinase [Bryobacteraceae bacterium]